MATIVEQLGQRVAVLRKRAGHKQESLARQARSSASTVSRLEHGKAVPTLEVLSRIAAALGASLSDLFDFTQPTANQRRRTALKRISHMLRSRTSADVEDVLQIVRRVFEIKRRERKTRKRPGPSAPSHKKRRKRRSA